MSPQFKPNLERHSRLSLWLLASFFVILWFAGGSARADVAGQIVVRLAAWAFLIAWLFLPVARRWDRMVPTGWLIVGAIACAAIQLIPLPPALWTILPGRSLIAEGATVIGMAQPWRPISLSPSATENALGSLIVAATVLLYSAGLRSQPRLSMIAVWLVLICMSATLGLVQFSGASFDYPLINDIPGMVSANFANRNHFALFMAFGCVLAPVWGFADRRAAAWKKLGSLALLPLFALIVLASGSRTGILLYGLGLVGGLAIVRRGIAGFLHPLGARYRVIAVSGFMAMMGIVIFFAVAFGRAVSVERAMALDTSDDLRRRALPYLIEAIGRFFPVGSGFGAFDPVYRIFEPNTLLSPQYFNHAHNDWVEIVLDGGVAALVLALVAILWWLRASWLAWTRHADKTALAGSVLIGQAMVASVFDYPVRTPLIMGVVVFAAQLLFWRKGAAPAAPRQPTLRQESRGL